MATYVKIVNRFDPSMTATVNTGAVYEAGGNECFTDNEVIADVKRYIVEAVPDAEPEVYTSMAVWTRNYVYDVEYKVLYKDLYGIAAGFIVKLQYGKQMDGTERYTFSMEEYDTNMCRREIPLPNRAKAFRSRTGVPQNNPKQLTFCDPGKELVKEFVEAMITPNRRKAFADFAAADRENRLEDANTKNLLDIESMDILPEFEKITRDAAMGLPETTDLPNRREIWLFRGTYGAGISLEMYKAYMCFRLDRGSDRNAEGFDTVFIRLLHEIVSRSNIDITAHLEYNDTGRAMAFDMARRIGQCYRDVKYRMMFGMWEGIMKEWKRNPARD